MNILELLEVIDPHMKNTEGVVLTFDDGQIAKKKFSHYLRLHGLIGPDAFRENLLVQTILDDNIDDVISALVDGAKKDKIILLSEKVQHQYNHLFVEYKKLRNEYFNKYNEDRKSFAIRYSKTHELFGAVMKTLNSSFREINEVAEKAVKEHILRQCKSLSDAKEYVGSL